MKPAGGEAPGMYGARAALYDVLYSFKDYAAEAAAVRERLAARGGPEGARVLEAACGTGEHLRHLVSWSRGAWR